MTQTHATLFVRTTTRLLLIAASSILVHAESELDRLTATAVARNPLVQAAREEVEQALCRHQATLAFFDPALVAVAGRARRARGIPGATGFTSVTNNAFAVKGGLEVPVRPGAYLGIGAAERYLEEPGDDRDHLLQTLLGVQLRVPLLRDRGFRQWSVEEAMALAEYNEAVSRLLSVSQKLRFDLTRGYIAVYEALASYRVAQEATGRFQALLDEAKELVELEVVPQYQLHAAQMELELRREEELQAKQVHAVNQVRLWRLVAAEEPTPLREDPAFLVAWAGQVALSPDYALQSVLGARGVYREQLSQLVLAEARVDRAQDNLRPDLSVNVAGTWQGEDDDSLLGGNRTLSGRHVGGEVSLVWRRPLRLRAERSELRRTQAQVAELRERLRDTELQVLADLQTAVLEFNTAQKRLQLVSRAVTAAERTLSAERERFRLGEGRSRYVLDAQKDLTQVRQREMRVAAALLRAHAGFEYASGYNLAGGSRP